MSYWKNLNNLIITTEFSRGDIAASSKNYVQCSDGEVAAFQYLFNNEDDVPLVQIYRSVDGNDIPIAIAAVMAGADILRGLFTTGIIPTAGLFDDSCRFLRVDY